MSIREDRLQRILRRLGRLSRSLPAAQRAACRCISEDVIALDAEWARRVRAAGETKIEQGLPQQHPPVEPQRRSGTERTAARHPVRAQGPVEAPTTLAAERTGRSPLVSEVGAKRERALGRPLSPHVEYSQTVRVGRICERMGGIPAVEVESEGKRHRQVETTVSVEQEQSDSGGACARFTTVEARTSTDDVPECEIPSVGRECGGKSRRADGCATRSEEVVPRLAISSREAALHSPNASRKAPEDETVQVVKRRRRSGRANPSEPLQIARQARVEHCGAGHPLTASREGRRSGEQCELESPENNFESKSCQPAVAAPSGLDRKHASAVKDVARLSQGVSASEVCASQNRSAAASLDESTEVPKSAGVDFEGKIGKVRLLENPPGARDAFLSTPGGMSQDFLSRGNMNADFDARAVKKQKTSVSPVSALKAFRADIARARAAEPTVVRLGSILVGKGGQSRGLPTLVDALSAQRVAEEKCRKEKARGGKNTSKKPCEQCRGDMRERLERLGHRNVERSLATWAAKGECLFNNHAHEEVPGLDKDFQRPFVEMHAGAAPSFQSTPSDSPQERVSA